jgi:hypothetical protein
MKLFRITYTADTKETHQAYWYCKAYDSEHALMKWHDTNEGDYELVDGPVAVKGKANE